MKVFALPNVADRSAASGVIPYSTIPSSSRTFSPWANTPTSPPKQMLTPAASAALKLARLATSAGVGLLFPLIQPSKYVA